MFITRHNPPILWNTDEGAGAGQAPDDQATPDAGQPNEQAGIEQQQQEIDWQKRYGDLQPEYTRATQEAAELRQRDQLYQSLLYADDEDTRRQAAQALGIELADDGTQDDTQDQPYLTREEWSQFQAQQRQAQQAQQQQQAQEQQVAWLDTYVDAQLKQLNVDEADADWIVQKAINMPTQGPDGATVPDIKAAYEALKARDLAQQKKWANSKRTHQFSGVGGEGTQVPDLDNRQQRVDYMTARLQANEQQ